MGVSPLIAHCGRSNLGWQRARGQLRPIEVGETMLDWPDKQSADLGWAYVSIGGDVYSEAVVVVVTLEVGEPRIRTVEWGRP